MSKTIIIGAGVSGLVAARELQSAGHEVLVLDKGRGVGGRLATRRFSEFEGVRFDHGAQFFTARSQEFKIAVASWEMHRIVRRWFDGYPSPHDEKPHDVYTRFCGEDGMTGIAKHLARDLDVRLGEEVGQLHFEAGSWTVRTMMDTKYFADRLLLTAPIPQSLSLFDSSGETLAEDVRRKLESVEYEPCFAVLALLEDASLIPEPGALYLNEEPLAWLGDNFQKGISSRPGTVTIHSTSAFARAYYDEDEIAVGEYLIEAACDYLGCEVDEFQVRRWRYAKADNALHVGALHVPELKVCFAGDGLNGARVEGAYLSGLEAARVLEEQL